MTTSAIRKRLPLVSFGFGQRQMTNHQRLLFRSRLSNFFLQALARIANTFVLVRIGWPQTAHLGCNLAHFLAVNPSDADLRLLGIHSRFNTGGQRVLDGMRVSQVEHYSRLSLQLSPISYAHDFQFPGPPSGHALYLL